MKKDPRTFPVWFPAVAIGGGLIAIVIIITIVALQHVRH